MAQVRTDMYNILTFRGSSILLLAALSLGRNYVIPSHNIISRCRRCCCRRPYTEETLEELGESGVKNLIVVPVSFVSEHIETLVHPSLLCRTI